MNKHSTEKRVQVIAALVEGVGVNATCRLTGVAKNTVLKLLADVGSACAEYHYKHVRNLRSSRVRVDEIWSFRYCKAANVPEEMNGKYGVGNVWTWTAIDADSKLCISWFVGTREIQCGMAFISDLADRLAERIQLTSDSLGVYLKAGSAIFGDDVDFAMLVKQYSAQRDVGCRYSPPVCTGAKRTPISCNPDPNHVSTSYAERQNLTMRMSMRRFTRLTNAFSKKIENHEHAIALYFMHYNFCRVHMTLKATPAMAAGLTDHVWELEELAGLLDGESN